MTKKTLNIQKHTTLMVRLPETRFSTQIDKSKAKWIIFSSYLSPQHFDDIDFFTGFYNPIIDTWKVGHYEVALMSGKLTQQHEQILQALKLDYASLEHIPDLSKPGLIVMDMDSTAIQIECIDEIAKLAGVGEQVSAVTERAMQGELNFEQSLRQRVAALENADEGIIAQVKEKLPLTADLEALIHTLKQFGWKTAIVSGGFTYFSDKLKAQLDLDHAQSNTLEIIDGKLTGKVLGEIVGAEKKAHILQELAQQYGIEHANTIAVGDGANDLVMMNTAGLGIAFHAKPKVEKQAQTAIRYSGLGGVLCILSGALAKQQKVSWQAKP